MTTVSTRTIGALDLSVVEAGQGGRPLLLVHGFTGAKEDFGDWFETLADDGWWVAAPDQRGHGASAKPDAEADYSLAHFADDLAALVDELGWSTFCLLGHSMGGAIVEEMALRMPERVEKLVLMDTHHGPWEGLDPESVQKGGDIIRTEGLPALLELLDAFAGERSEADQRMRDTRPGYIEFGESKMAVVSPAMYAAMAYELHVRADRLAELAEFPKPTLVIVGEQDDDFLVRAAERMAETMPDATLAIIEKAAHSPQFENPDAWYEALSTFLGG
jgi:pimeloyl-ACP methyl ester carboxylesterase